MAVDGSITIGAIFTTDKFDRQIAKFESDMKKEEEKLELKLNAKIQAENELKKHKQDIFDLEQEYEKLAPKVERYNELISQSKAGTNLSPKDFQFISDIQNSNVLSQYDKMGSQLDGMYAKEERLNAKVQQKAYAYKQVVDKVDEYKQKIENVKIQKQVADANRLKDSFNGVGKSIQDAVGKAAKLALGIFGIRSAFMFLRRASSDLASYDQQYATNLEYIRYALTQMIAPVLQWIVNLAAKLLGYINAIMQGWFGINLFSRGSAENFNKMKAGASGVSKAVKQIKKDLAGFDEINKLTDQSDTGTSVGAGGVGVGVPSFDLSALSGEPPKWLQWIIGHKNEILTIMASVAAGLLAWKLGFGALMSLGIAVAVYGVIKAVKGLLAFIKNPTWKNFKKFLGGLALAITGVAIAMIAFNATNPVGWILLAIGAVVALTTAIIGLIAKLITNKAKILDTKKAQEELTQAQQKAKEATDAYVNAVDRAEQAQKELTEAEKKNKLSGEELYQAVQNGTLDYQNMNGAQREVYKAYLNNKSAQEELKNATKELNNAKKEETKASWENQLAIAKEKGNYDEFRNSVVKAYKDGKLSAEEARDYIERAMGDMSDSSRQTFTKDLPNDIKNGLDPKKYESAWSRFKTKWNEFWNNLKSKISMYFEVNYSAKGGGKGSKGYGGGVGTRAHGGIYYPSKLPKLASGGIINVPGRGVPYNGAIIGERGAEAVVPLTDNQQMELLGATIGKYITINANVINTMNGRVISRELKQIKNEQDFAFNQ